MSNAFFITGTDTGVGKTLVAATLLQLAQDIGQSTLGLKPVAAGCEMIDGQWMNDDARELMLASTSNPHYEMVNPVALREPMAPHIAAKREGMHISCADLLNHCQPLIGTAEFMVVEGAGGWQVPINETETMADLAKGLSCPVILVVGMRLGCINHALLTAAAIRQTGLRIDGWVANHIDKSMSVMDDNVVTLEDRLNAPLIGRIPWSEDANPRNTAPHLTLNFLN